MRKEGIYTLFETLSIGTWEFSDELKVSSKTKKESHYETLVGAEGFEPPTLWV